MKCIGCDTPIPPGGTKCPMCGAPVKIDAPVTPQQTVQAPIQITPLHIDNTAKFSSKRVSLASIIGGGLALLFLYSVNGQHNKTGATAVPAGSSPTATAPVELQPIIILTGKARAIKQKHPDWKDEICIAVANNELRVGMNIDQAKEAWGSINGVNTSEGSYGVHRQWIFDNGVTRRYVYTENGSVTSWQH